jgi:hypothetical protein
MNLSPSLSFEILRVFSGPQFDSASQYELYLTPVPKPKKSSLCEPSGELLAESGVRQRYDEKPIFLNLPTCQPT